MTTQTKPDVVRLSELTDIVEAVPYLLGFHPRDSIVAVALRGPRSRLGFTCRLDLLPRKYDADVAAMFAARMEHAKADAVLLFLYADPPADDGRLPRRALVDAVRDALPVPLRDALLVTDDRVWSYVCDEAECCPPEGRLRAKDSTGATTLAAAHALHGDAVLPNREAVVASVAAVGGVTALSMLQACNRMADEVIDELEQGRLTEESLGFLEEMLARYADRPAEMAHDDAANLTVRLLDIPFRDKVIGRLARNDEELAGLIRAAARLAQPPYDAPIASVLAMAEYMSGSGVAALAAAERALATNPDYSLAQLVQECIERQLHPKEVRRVWRRG